MNLMEYKSELKDKSPLSFINDGVKLFHNDFFQILEDLEFKNQLASKMYQEAMNNDIWSYYRNFIRDFGLQPLLSIYNGDTLSKISQNKKYVIIAVMLEKNVNRILEYALTDSKFLDILEQNGSNYYSLLYNINYDLIKIYLRKRLMFAIQYFVLDDSDYLKLFNDPMVTDEMIVSLIRKIYNVDLLSDFFIKDKRAIKIFNQLNKQTIMYLIEKKIKFNDKIINSNKMFETIKEDSLVNLRKNINKLTIANGNIDIEKKLEKYYLDLLSNYNPVTKLFRQYENLDNNINEKLDGYILNKKIIYGLYSKEELQEITSKKISEIIIDYLFKDDIYNVFINIKEIISYNKKKKIISDNIIEFYRYVLNIDSKSNEGKLSFFNKIRDVKVDALYYNNLRKLKNNSYQEIKNRVLRPSDKNKDAELSNKYQTTVYDYRNSEFLILVRSILRKFDSKTSNRRDCYSLISNNHTEVFNDYCFIYGYDNFDIKKILHIYEHDAFSYNSLSNETTDYINRLYTPEELIDATIKINEIQILNEKRDGYYEALKPSYIIAIDEINSKIVNESKRLNIPIILIKRRVKDKKVIIEDYGRESREIASYLEDSDSVIRYTSDYGITYQEEERRNKYR